MRGSMKKLALKLSVTVLLIVLVLLPACSSGGNASSEVIAWQPYKQGLQAAAAQNKKAFLYFRADW